MEIKKGTTLYFAEADYKHLQIIKEVEGLEDATLVRCQQSAEKYAKHLLKEHSGEINTTHNIPVIINQLIPTYPELKSYMSIARFLKDCYYDRNYETDSYLELDEEDYREYLDKSINFIEFLRGLCLTELGKNSPTLF